MGVAFGATQNVLLLIAAPLFQMRLRSFSICWPAPSALMHSQNAVRLFMGCLISLNTIAHTLLPNFKTIKKWLVVMARNILLNLALHHQKYLLHLLA